MRVGGNISPEILSVEQYPPIEGYVEVRVRENINEIEMTDEQSETTIPMFEYDEYTFLLQNRDGLKEDIEKNLSDWLATGRMIEYNAQASIAVDMAAALEVLGVEA